MGDDWSPWIGRTSEGEDCVTPGMVAGLTATLDWPANRTPGEFAPQGIHWLLAPDRAAASSLGPDGHPARGEFLPPIPLPRRQWAASAVRFHRPIRIGAAVRRTSRVTAVTTKQGSTGPLVFVDIDHTLTAAGEAAIEERQTLVYRDGGVTPGGGAEAEAAADFARDLVPGPVLLFRYSALTFNGHRIHYDQPYATGVEGYPDLVVHGPLQATLMLDLCTAEFGDNRLTSFKFRGVSTALAGRPLRIAGQRAGTAITLTARSGNHVTMRATAELGPA